MFTISIKSAPTIVCFLLLLPEPPQQKSNKTLYCRLEPHQKKRSVPEAKTQKEPHGSSTTPEKDQQHLMNLDPSNHLKTNADVWITGGENSIQNGDFHPSGSTTKTTIHFGPSNKMEGTFSKRIVFNGF